MPSVASRGRGRRRAMSEINMVPFIDVMLVLLIIFMVSAPLITTGVVDLPSMGKSKQRPQSVIEVIIGPDEKLKIRVDKSEPTAIGSTQLAAKVKEAQAGSAEVPVIISADKQVRYESVVKVMDTLQRAGVLRVGLAVRQGS
ncbi:protein TolR [Ideonella sp.]|uniref:protein TolR n=1 Tax=Ideonella sp. TaxID=1929293 RepID=UPI0037C14D8C